MNKAIRQIKEILIKNIQKELKGIHKVAVPFSGSLDSFLVAFLVKNFTKAKPHLYTIGYPDCYDFKQSRISAKLLSTSHKFINLSNYDLPLMLEGYRKLTGDKDKVSISYSLPFYILLSEIREKYVITGHGADTLFGGFFKYLSCKKSELKDCIKKNYKEFLAKLPERELKIAKRFDKKLILPFTDKELSDLVFTLPEEFFIKENERKYILRQVAEDLGLPKKITNAPKKAIQYSSGILKNLRHIW